MAKALVEAADAAGVQTDSLAGIGVGSPGDTDEKTGDVSEARNLPGLGGQPSRSARRSPTRSARRCGSATTSTSPPTPSSSSGAGKPYDSILGVFWGTGVGGGLILDGKRWIGRGAAGEIGHMVVKDRRRPLSVRAPRLHGGLRGPRGDGGEGAHASTTTGRRRSCSRSWRSAGATGSRAAIWERALKHDDELAEKLIERALEALGAGRRLGGQPARRRGGDHRRRARGALRPAVRREDRRADAPAPVRGRPPAGDARRRARRPRRRDRRVLLFDEE